MSHGNPDDARFRPLPENGEDWPSPTSFSGDFYREPDDVHRGVTLSAGPPGPIGLGNDFGDGDFFGLDRDGSCQKGLDLDYGSYSGLEKPFFDRRVLSKRGARGAFAEERFSEGDVPPDAPRDKFFQFEVTTLFATGGAGAAPEVGNHVIDFLNEQAVSTVNKVNRKKFSIKADVFVGSMMCSMNVRVYLQASGQLAIEFQRRSGDSVSFNLAFRQASEYLKPRLNLVVDAPAPPTALVSFEPPPLPEGHVVAVTDADLTPVLEMAQQKESPWLQAEAATSLSEIAAEGNPVLCSARVFQSLGELLQASPTEVAHPTSHLVHQLAQRSDTAPLFAAQCLLPQLLEKVKATSTHPQVRLQLAQALSAGAQRQSKATLPEKDAAALLGAFSEFFAQETAWANMDQEVMQCIETAAYALQSQFAST